MSTSAAERKRVIDAKGFAVETAGRAIGRRARHGAARAWRSGGADITERRPASHASTATTDYAPV